MTDPNANAGAGGDRDGGLGDGGTAGTSGNGSAGASGDDGEGDDGCFPNPGVFAEICPVICPESCNGEDDDCDGEVDEDGMEEPCALPNAVAACIEGECLIVECSDQFRDCDDEANTGCEAAPDDVLNCGSCGHVCELPHAVEACVDGACVPAGCEALFGDCDDDPNECETAVNTLDDCAVCGVPCLDVPNATASCDTGYCAPGTCTDGYGDCNGAPGDGCEQTLNSEEHCGACETACALPGALSACTTGVCLATGCEAEHDDCDSDPTDGCESLDTSEHCGACNAPCTDSLLNVESASCEDMACRLTCAAQFADCDGNPATGCETDVWTNARCGACNRPCAIPNAVVECTTGTCNFVRCQDNFGDCNDDLGRDGCETRLNQDEFCGSCDTDCTGTSDPVCTGGRCSDVVCPDPNTADCAQNGLPCEVDLLNDAQNCGACGARCTFTTASPHATLRCSTGHCSPRCDALWGDCNGDYRDGCETPLNTLTSCGSCGTPCAIANAAETCATGSCRVDSCDDDWADCNGDDTSCETQLGTTSNCDGCAEDCSLPNAVATCGGSAGSHACQVSACTQPYYANCDGAPGNGCEVDRRSNTQNCGSCGNDCGAHPNVRSASCSGSACSYTCDSGFGNCTSAPGCETPLDTLDDCGGCGTGCSRTNGTASCSGGRCALTGCDTGYDNCDGDDDNGCEPLDTLQNCGGCASPCAIVNASASCQGGSCQLTACNDGWDDCDGDDGNGCERNIEPPASGGQGPCMPDADCAQFSYDGRAYYFCTGSRSWTDARARCQLQLLGDLVHINDAAEDAFVRSHLTANAWIGARDTTEGSWRWANDNGLFWTGASGGTANAYAHWSAGEPNDYNASEDCAEIRTDGAWNDQACANSYDFVCEVQADLCPDDPSKANPGQCGCGVPDTDSDDDGTANCNDACPNNAPKVAPGQCGCATADTDSDGDGTANCSDDCPNDPDKTEPGQCDCGMPDTDSDGDGIANCDDGCPGDPRRTTPPCGFNYTPSNFDPASIDFDAAPPAATLNCGTTTVDTTGSVTITNWCGTAPTPLIRTQSGGPEVVILPVNDLTVNSGATLRLIGTRPVILAVRGNATVNGTINARGLGATPGAGGNASCSGGNGANGVADSGGNDGDGGGGGGAFGAVGAAGGTGHGGGSGGGAGSVEGSTNLVPLRGGCRGGTGGSGGAGGAGGGAVQISASAAIAINSGGIVSASGGGGLPGDAAEEGGGGGGSGGAILLQGATVTVSAGAWVTTNGGAGASGSSTVNSNGSPGTDGYPNQTARAPGGPGRNGGGPGGNGGAQQGAATNGQNGSFENEGCFLFCEEGGGGGGGGGGAGRIRIHGTGTCSLSGSISPAASTSCP